MTSISRQDATRGKRQCERSEAILLLAQSASDRLLRRYAPRNDRLLQNAPKVGCHAEFGFLGALGVLAAHGLAF